MNYFYSVTNTVTNSFREEQREDSLVFHNIPQSPNETRDTLMSSILTIVKACGYDLKYSEIRYLKVLDKNSTVVVDQLTSPPSVLVQLIDCEVKNSILEAFLKTTSTDNRLTAAILGGDHETMIVIEPELSPIKVRIKQQAAAFKTKGYLEDIRVVREDIDEDYNIDVKCRGEWHRVYSVEQLLQLVR